MKTKCEHEKEPITVTIKDEIQEISYIEEICKRCLKAFRKGCVMISENKEKP